MDSLRCSPESYERPGSLPSRISAARGCFQSAPPSTPAVQLVPRQTVATAVQYPFHNATDRHRAMRGMSHLLQRSSLFVRQDTRQTFGSVENLGRLPGRLRVGQRPVDHKSHAIHQLAHDREWRRRPANPRRGTRGGGSRRRIVGRARAFINYRSHLSRLLDGHTGKLFDFPLLCGEGILWRVGR